MSKVIVVQFPGVNCEYESERVIEAVGLTAEIRRWNDAAEAVKNAAAVFIPGGFSYQDRIRAGVVAAKDRVMDSIVAVAARGVPVLGICNGAQILVESGVVPDFDDGKIDVALAPNKMTGRHGYYCNWVYLKKGPARCLFTEFMAGDPQRALPVPLAHAEGRFVTGSDAVRARLEAGEGVAVAYASASGARAESFPENPNGSCFAIAGLTNPAGNVLAIMPHPERAAWAHQVPRRMAAGWGEARSRLTREGLFAPGPGMGFFSSLKKALS